MNPVLKLAVAIVVFASFIVASVFTVSAPRAANFERTDTFTVNRLSKGDLLPSIPAGTVRSKVKLVPVAKRPPVGCEPMFSTISHPERAQLYGRCAA